MNFDIDIKETIYSDEMTAGVKKYLFIMDTFHSLKDITNNLEFQKKYKGFYRVRRNDNFCHEYFKIMQLYRNNVKASFDNVFDLVSKINNRNEASFSSKLLHTINNTMPILDKNVLINLGLYSKYVKKNSDKKQIFIELENKINSVINSDIGKKWIYEFNSFLINELKLSSDSISDVKKIDFILWRIK